MGEHEGGESGRGEGMPEEGEGRAREGGKEGRKKGEGVVGV